MKYILCKTYIYKNILKILKKVVSNCKACNKAKNYICHGITSDHLSYNISLVKLSLDITGPFNSLDYSYYENAKTSFYLLNMTDMYTRYTKTEILNDPKSNTLSNCFYKKCIIKFNTRKFIRTDRGTQFTSTYFSGTM